MTDASKKVFHEGYEIELVISLNPDGTFNWEAVIQRLIGGSLHTQKIFANEPLTASNKASAELQAFAKAKAAIDDGKLAI